MCTVTFLPLNDSVVLTSNRDEQTARLPAALPEVAEGNSGKILFPRDGQAGGTWVAMHNNGNAMVLLNGAFKRHEHEPPYRKSRGLVFLEVFDTTDPASMFGRINLRGIEPFTLVLWGNGRLTEMRWDGIEKYITSKDVTIPHIWCSATLYDVEVAALRQRWFAQWLDGTQPKTAETIRAFHEFAGDGDESTNLRMNRGGMLQTVSITGIEITKNKAVMHYKDMLTGIASVNEWYLHNGQPHA